MESVAAAKTTPNSYLPLCLFPTLPPTPPTHDIRPNTPHDIRPRPPHLRAAFLRHSFCALSITEPGAGAYGML